MLFNTLPHGLYLVANFTTDKSKFLWCVEEALRGGVDIVQLRAKQLNKNDFLILAQHVQACCIKYKKPLIINDHVEIAPMVGADGVHLGEDDMDIKQAREILGQSAMIGKSLSPHQQDCSENVYADYLAASPLFYTPTKPDGIHPFGLKELSDLIVRSTHPVVAIGGIHTHNLNEVLDTGCRFIAVVSAIMNASNPRTETRKLKKIMDEYYG